MITINQQTIDSLSPNPAATKNGKGLVSKFITLKKDTDNTLLWGECQGSGKNPYFTSVDFINEAPTFRCSCPSRQFPCKHGIGLLFAFVEGKNFEQVADIPEDIKNKRSKIETRKEKKETEIVSLKEKGAEPKKINTTAVLKKIEQQFIGIANAQKLLQNIVSLGLASIDAKEKRNLADQIKELGNYPIAGIQNAFSRLLLEIEVIQNENYVNAIDQVNIISALLKKATEYLQAKKENPAMNPDIDSCIEEQIGTVWKLTDLVSLGLYQENVELVQLSFDVVDDVARKEITETGTWIELNTGKIYKTHNFRPYKALKFIKEENSVNGICKIKDLYIYPGDANPRIRWETNDFIIEELQDQHCEKIISFAETDYKKAINQAKNFMKNPLMTKKPTLLISVSKAFQIEDDLVLEDTQGQCITLRNTDDAGTASFLKSILPASCNDTALLITLENDLANGFISANPLSLITPSKIVKLLF